ncbi:hypothetical protein THAOC_20921 [Thalassiosira oceanica]|uniref:Mutator-like transposase domain-containing protein n=1 Tax=Thalassiosira oceanica TaxID=159749 RepID=K0SD92_THAOC|nr:hypothetical protein THAOC_20921 [Thalassiosira oceanica]|eukprot:EJK58916.1 hypothetical protein THAOC_20921 [Thalassiosira oceanica]
MPSLYTGSPVAPPAVTPPVTTRTLHRQANTLNDELLLAIEALPRFLPLYWHTVKGLEELLREGGLHLPDKLLTNALKSIKVGERGWEKNNYQKKVHYCPCANGKAYDSPMKQRKGDPILCSVNEGYFAGFDFKFIGKYLQSSNEPAAAGGASSTTSTSSTGDEAARGTGEQGNASTAGATSASTAGNETARDTASGERGNEAMSSAADESSNEQAADESSNEHAAAGDASSATSSTGDEMARGSSLGNETARGTAAGERRNETAAGERHNESGDETARGSSLDEQGNASTAGATSPSADESSTATGGPSAQPGEGWANGVLRRNNCADPNCSVDHSSSPGRAVTPGAHIITPRNPKGNLAFLPAVDETPDGSPIGLCIAQLGLQSRCIKIGEDHRTKCEEGELTPGAHIITPRNPKGNLAFLPAVDETPDGSPIGLCIAQLGLQSRCIKIGEDHRTKCEEGELRIERDGRMHKGFEVYEVFVCNKCDFRKKVPYVQTETISTRKKKRGANPDLVGERFVHAAHGSGVTITQLGEVCDQLGLVRSGNKGLQGMVKKRKEYVSEAAEEQMRKNRIEHNEEVRRRHGSSADVKFTDASGISHSFAAGPVCADGAGATRSYQHRVTGSQHCTVICSNMTHKPLMLKHHQKSCVLCQRAISKLVVDGMRAQDITADDLLHEGRCYRNTALSPAQAEESALEELAETLLIDPQTNKFRSNEEAILALQVVTDGDTKGSKRFINKQVSLVPCFAGKAEQIPDIGHFIKAINNGFYKLKETCPELGGAKLLDAARIKVICSDVNKNIRQYGGKVAELDKELADYQERKENLRNAALNDIDAIGPHHCGDHSSCGDQCKYKEIENSYISKYKESPPAGKEGLNAENKEDRAEIVKLYEADIKSDYAKVARFRGATMSMSKAGQAKVNKVISQRLDKSNIDRVSETLSSNDCEGYFNMLTKFSQGKRINLDQTDSWQCFGMLAAGRKSNDRFEDEVHSLAGMKSMYVRDVQVDRCLRIKDKKRARQQTDVYKDRKKVKQMAKLQDSQKSLTLPGRHKSNKLNAKDNCKSAPEKPQKKRKKRRTKCKNCNCLHDGECPWPAGVNPDSVKPKSKTQLKEEKKMQELKEEMRSILHLIK